VGRRGYKKKEEVPAAEVRGPKIGRFKAEKDVDLWLAESGKEGTSLEDVSGRAVPLGGCEAIGAKKQHLAESKEEEKRIVPQRAKKGEGRKKACSS